MLERSGRWLAVLLPLLFSAVAGNTVLAADRNPELLTGHDPTSRTGSFFTSAVLLSPSARGYDCRLASLATDFLAPPQETPSSHIRHLPGVPKPVLMVLVGFLCISLVHDRKTWVAVATFLLSFGHYWLTVVPQSIACHRHRRHLERLSPREEAALLLKPAPLCLLSHHASCLPAFGADNKKYSNGSSAIVSRHHAVGRLLPSLPLHADQLTSLSWQLTLAQMARAPPSGC